MYISTFIFLLIIIIAYLYRNKTFLIALFSLLFVSYFGFLIHEISQNKIESNFIYLDKKVSLKGIVEEVSRTKKGKLKLIIQINHLFNHQLKHPLNCKVLAYPDLKLSHINLGDTIYFKTEINRFKFFGNPWGFDFGKYNLRKGIIGFVFLKKENVLFKKHLQHNSIALISSKLNNQLSRFLNGQELEVCKAFLWGERMGVSEDVMKAFVNTGTIHILAVSGLHVGILFSIIIYFFRFFSRWISKKQATILAIIIAWGYAWITGFSPSILRSVIVFTLIFINDILEKRRNEMVLMSLSALFLLVYDTNYLFDIGFQLTYSALIGIYMFYPYLSKIIVIDNKIVNYFYSPLIIGLSAQLTTLPIILYNFHQFPNYFTFANLTLVPFSFMIIVLGVGFYLFSFSIFIQSFFGVLLKYVLKLMISIVLFFDNLPFSVAKNFVLNEYDFLLLVLFLIFLQYVLHFKKFKYQLIIFALFILSYFQYKRYNYLNACFIARVGGIKNDYIIKNNSKLIYITDNPKKSMYTYNQVCSFYQTSNELIYLKSKQNNYKFLKLSLNQNSTFEKRDFLILKMW